MKREWIFGLCLILLIVILALIFIAPSGYDSYAREEKKNVLSHNTGDIAGIRSYSIDMKAAMPAYPDTILVYKFNPPEVNAKTTLSLAKKFNVTGNMVGEQGIQSKDLRYSIWTSKKSGANEYHDSQRPNKAMDTPSQLPSEENAIIVASQYLKKNNLLPEGAEKGKASYEYVSSLDKEGNDIPYYGRVTVSFGRTLNGMEVKGAGVSVTMGGNGDIIGYSSDWRNYTPYKNYPIKSPESAYNELKRSGIKTGIGNPVSVSIDTVYLAYKQTPPAFEEKYLEPVWVFKGEKTSKDATTKPITEYLPALTDDAVKSLSSI